MSSAKIELHLHLDGSIHLPWAYETARKNKVIASDMSFAEYYNLFYRTDYKTREEGFKKFDYPIAVMQKPQDIAEATRILVQELADQGLAYAEIRLASQQHMLEGLSQKEVLQSVLDGVDQAKKTADIDIGIINCLMHKGENALVNEALNYDSIEAARAFLHQGVVGLDLAGYENNGDFMLYAPLFKKAKEYGIPCTIHAGEMGFGQHVHEAILMGADRIGHGVNCVQSAEMLQEVLDTQIPLEVCVTSNVKEARNYAAHPFTQLLRAGARVTINSDNMMFSRTSLENEYRMLKMIGITEQELERCTYNALEAAFCDEETKERIRRKL